MSLRIALRHSARSLVRTPGLSFAVVMTIAVGIGSNAAVHGFIRGLMASDQAREAPLAVARVGFLLSVAAAAVLVIACATVMCFLLARASARSKETAVRSALGADRLQLMKELASDGALISLAGGAAGTLLARWTVAVIPALFFEADAEQLMFVPDQWAILAVAATCMAITMACSVIPLVEIRHDDPARVLQRESLGSSRSTHRLRSILVVLQTTCCCLLVISASLTLKSFREALQTGTGHRRDKPILVTVQAKPRATRSEFSADGLSYFRDVEQAAQKMPGVTATAWVARPPGSRPALQSLRIERPESRLRDVLIDVASFTPASLAVVSVPPIEGRMFGAGDTPQSCRVAIVNEDAARDMFDGSAVGQSIEDPIGKRVEIVGVVVTRAQAKSRTTDRPTIYYYAEQTEPPNGVVGAAQFRARERTHMTRVMLDANIVSANYFDVVGLQRVSGALFATSSADRCRVGVIDQAAADLYFNGDAVGGAVIDDDGRRTTIIGIVQSSQLRHWQRPAMPTIYFPVWQDFTPRMTLFLATPEAADEKVAFVAAQLAAVEGGTGDVRATTLDAHLTRMALAPERISAVLVVAAASMAFVIGTLGVYGVMAESARQRRRETALRIALGAQRWRVLGQLLGAGVRLGAAGGVAGLVGSFIAAPWLTLTGRSMIADDIWPWLSGPLALMAIVAIASVLPARLALLVDPMVVLREP